MKSFPNSREVQNLSSDTFQDQLLCFYPQRQSKAGEEALDRMALDRMALDSCRLSLKSPALTLTRGVTLISVTSSETW